MAEGSRPPSDRLSAIFRAGSALLLLNSLYLAAFATPSLFYMTNVAVHVLGGAALLVVGALWLRPRLGAMRLPARLATVLIAAGAALGLALAYTGSTTRFRWLLLSHIAVIGTGAGLALVLALAKAVSAGRTRLRPAHAVGVVVLLAAAGWSSAFALKQRRPSARRSAS